MKSSNLTSVTEFTLLGLSSWPELQVYLFLLFLMIYLMILLGNLLIVLILVNTFLHMPMYFFLTNLSIIEDCYTSCVFPQMLGHFFAKIKSISYSWCVTQVYSFLSFGIAECCILSVMSFHPYLAIQDSLRYSVTRNRDMCMRLVTGSWMVDLMASMVATVATIHPSCWRDNVINHFLCEMPAFLHLSCTDTSQAEIISLIFCVFTLLCPVIFITFSYTDIINIVLRSHSAQGCRKAFSTCSSHLLVVILFFVTVMSLYMRSKSLYSPDKDKVITVFYIAFTPILNPLIYSLRNKEMKIALMKLLGKKNNNRGT